jgi:hypothetical protein
MGIERSDKRIFGEGKEGADGAGSFGNDDIVASIDAFAIVPDDIVMIVDAAHPWGLVDPSVQDRRALRHVV